MSEQAKRQDAAFAVVVVVLAVALTTIGNGKFGLGIMEILQIDLGRQWEWSARYFDMLAGNRRGPLWPFMMRYWNMLVGESDLATRGLSSLLFIASLFATWFLTRDLLGWRVRYALVALLLCYPLLIEYGRDARSYMLHFLLVGATMLLVSRVAEWGSRRDAVALFVVANLAVLNNFVCGVQFIPMGLGFVAFYRGAPHFRRAFVALAAAGLACLGWLYRFRLDHPEANAVWARQFVELITCDWAVVLVPLAVVALVVSARGDATNGGDWRRAARLARMHAVVLFLAPVLVWVVARTDLRATKIEYFLPLVLSLCVLLAVVVGEVGLRFGWRVAGVATLALIGLHTGQIAGILQEDSSVYAARERGFHREVMPVVAALEPSIKKVLVLPGYMSEGLTHYVRTGAIPNREYLPADPWSWEKVGKRPYCFVIFDQRVSAQAFIGLRDEMINRLYDGEENVMKSTTKREKMTLGCRR